MEKNEGKSKFSRQVEKLSQTNPGFYSLLVSSDIIHDDSPSNKRQLEEEMELRKLEKKLGIKKKKKLTSAFAKDGLDGSYLY